MNLQALFRGLPTAQILNENWDLDVTHLQIDSRSVSEGAVFIAIAGVSKDGHDFLASVVAKKPAAVVVQQDHWSAIVASKSLENFKNTIFVVENTRIALDFLADQYYDHPSEKMICLGVTGTNGKTSMTFLVEHLLNAAGILTGVIGTIDHHLGSQVWPSEMTTPDPLFLQKRLAEFVNHSAQAVIMEVSSHALDQSRVGRVQFDGVLFTNLTRDHLDYHKTMDNYFLAKEKLFSQLLKISSKKNKFAVVNVKDPYGSRLKVDDSALQISIGDQPALEKMTDHSLRVQKFYQYKILKMTMTETVFQIQTDEGIQLVHSPLSGEHNVQNVCLALSAARAVGISWADLLTSIRSFPGVPGRLQIVPNNLQKNIFVDYAHSPDALENVLLALHKMRQSSDFPAVKIWTIFGCGGDRDRGKRPMMAQVSEKYSDQVVVTSDNPRTESPESIIQEILSGFEKIKPQVQVDRQLAIESVIRSSASHDIILIAGKGHEDYQIIGSEKKYFSDYKCAQQACEKILAGDKK